MAIIPVTHQQAEVHAPSPAMGATMNASGAMMEMLATVYSNILMSAIREAIQNACDAAKRAGLSFAEGVQVELPTASNPMITVTDKGSGMTKAFMEAKDGYLSMGTSTKGGDDKSLGGLGVGRWAAYGYIRECTISTCHASDMIERTYFQYQGDDNIPKVQPAAEVPGTAVGTRVSFPVKETDLEEALRAVSWLRGIMKLTMGDTFTVDNAAVLPNVLPEPSGTVLDLAVVDAGLKGVKVYPMKGKNLKYSRQGLQLGSLVVLTNEEAGIGGLPFHVQTPSNTNSVFFDGMVVAIPMSFKVPFMPSREELKYTDEVDSLLKRIDKAARDALVARAKELFDRPDLASKGQLSELLGETNEDWNCFSRATGFNSQDKELSLALAAATGGNVWTGRMPIKVQPEMMAPDLTIRFARYSSKTLKFAFSAGGVLCVSGDKGMSISLSFNPSRPFTIVLDDLKTGGAARFREVVRRECMTGKREFVFLSSDAPGIAKAAADALNASYGNVLPLVLTSTLPIPAPRVVGAGTVSARTPRGSGGALTVYSQKSGKQEVASDSLTTHLSSSPRIWVEKNGGRLGGFQAHTVMNVLTDGWGGTLRTVLDELGVDKLYLLNAKQVAELGKLRDTLQDDGLLDLEDEEFDDTPSGKESLELVKAVRSWVSLEEALAKLVERQDIQDVLAGKRVRDVKECYQFNHFVTSLAREPRMVLTGTEFDREISPHVDLLSGTVRLHRAADVQALKTLCEGLSTIGNNMAVDASDPDARKELVETLIILGKKGTLDYSVVYEELKAKFPLLKLIPGEGAANARFADGLGHLCTALATVYG